MKSPASSTGNAYNHAATGKDTEQTLLERVHRFESTCQALQAQLDQTRQQLMQANKVLIVGQMMSSVTHELNNPLNAVLGYTQLLIKKTTDAALKNDLQKIEFETLRSVKIVQRLLSFVKQHKPERQLVNLNDIIVRMLEIQEHHRQLNNIQVIRAFDPALPPTYAEPHQLGQVVLNLMTNAEQAVMSSTEQRIIRISTACRADKTPRFIQMAIQDNGPGISDDDMKHIFDPFYTTKSQGTGLGLAICQQIVAEHQGRLSATSGLKQGTTFTLELPVTPEEGGESGDVRVESASPATISQGRGLIIDDEESIREFTKSVLTREGHEVDTAASGKEAMERIEEKDYDFIICDLRMPRLGGQAFYNMVKERDAALSRRIIFITGDTINQDTQRFFEETGNPYIYKPFALRDLVALVKRVLAG